MAEPRVVVPLVPVRLRPVTPKRMRVNPAVCSLPAGLMGSQGYFHERENTMKFEDDDNASFQNQTQAALGLPV
jgi:hypothetical protein